MSSGTPFVGHTAIVDPDNLTHVIKPLADGSVNVNASVTATATTTAKATAAAPTYGEGVDSPISQDLSGNLRVAATVNASVAATAHAAASSFGEGTSNGLVATLTGALRVFLENASLAVTGTFWQATQPISAAALPLPSGASTAAKQPAIGVAGTASVDVITVQGIAGATAIKTDSSGVTQPVSGTVTSNQGGAPWSQNLTQVAGTAIDVNSGAKSAGTIRVVLATDQPQLTAALKTDSSATTQPVSGTVTANAGTGTFTVGGVAASGASVSGNPVLQGSRAATANPTAVTDGQVVASMRDVLGKSVVVLNAPRALKGAAALTITSDVISHTLIAAGAAGVFNDIETLTISNTSATATRVDISDGTITYPYFVPAGDTRGISVPTMFPATTAATAWTAQCSVSVADVRIAVTFAKRTA